jgi:DNA-binding beta-propeller fold protein YncE
MRENRPSIRRTHKFSAAILLLLVLLPGAAFAGKKKTAPANAPQLQKRVMFDIRKIVWPNPPAVARIKFLEMYTGQQIDWSQFETGNKKAKQKWMDRLAGTKPAGDQIDWNKIPYQLNRTYGVAVDSKGLIYAADQAVGAIFIFNPETKAVEFIRNGHEAHFGLLNGLAMDDNDRLFVTDDRLREVLVFNSKHEEEGAFGADVLGNPGGLVIDTENRFLYVADTANDVICVFDADTFKLLRKIGTPGKKHQLTDPGTFALPTNVALDSDGNLYVTDTLNARIQIFDADGNFISTFGKRGDGPADFDRPKGIAIDKDGHIWVADAAQDRVKVFDRTGQLLIYFGQHGEYPGQFGAVYGITIDKNNRVIVSEQFPGRVQVFRYVTDAEADQTKKEQAEKSSAAKLAPSASTTATAQVQGSAAH